MVKLLTMIIMVLAILYFELRHLTFKKIQLLLKYFLNKLQERKFERILDAVLMRIFKIEFFIKKKSMDLKFMDLNNHLFPV